MIVRVKQCIVVLAIVALGACSSGSGGGTLTTLTSPGVTLPPGVTVLCANAVGASVRLIIGPLHGTVPEAEYHDTSFSIYMFASLNDCRSRGEWLTAASSAAGGYRAALLKVLSTACDAFNSRPVGGSGGTGAAVPYVPSGCR